MSEAMLTTYHDKIRKWAEQRGGHPATVKATSDGKPGILRLDFNPKDEGLKDVSWDDFFTKFDGEKLAFLYQEHTKDGEESRFSKLISREPGDAKARAAGN